MNENPGGGVSSTRRKEKRRKREEEEEGGKNIYIYISNTSKSPTKEGKSRRPKQVPKATDKG